jgi:hypothetical protein
MTADAFALGVDFGTSHTVAVLRWPDGRVKPLFFDGSPALLSGVFGDPAGTLFAGRDAAHAARSSPECFEPNPKRRIDDGVILLGTAEFPVADVVAAVLRRVGAEASRAAGGPIDAVTLTCPAAWGTHRRQVLIDASVKAGLDTPRLVPEPVAAAGYFLTAPGADLPVGSCIVVYDFGAGTFDASVVRRTADGFVVLASEGLPDAGGLDIDAAIFAHLGAVYSGRDPAAWRRLEQPDSVAARRARRVLWEDIRTAKEMLSRAAMTLIPIPLLDEDAPLGREQFERLAAPVLDRTVAATRGALRAARVTERDVSGFYLVGGSSRIPLATTLLHRAFRVAPTVLEQPELVVAEGSLHADPHLTTTRMPLAEPVLAPVAPPVPAAEPAPTRAAAGPAVGTARVPPAAPPGHPGLVRSILAVAGLVVVAAILTAGAVNWVPAGQATVVGVDVLLAVLLTPALPGVLLLGLAGVGVPPVRATPGPVRWVLVHAGWAVISAVPVTLELLWLAYQPDDWTAFQIWYGSAVWLAVAAGLLLLVVCGWWLARRTFQSGPRRAPSSLARARGYAAAVLAGAGCVMWWFVCVAPLHLHNRCVWSTAENSACDAGAAIWRQGGPLVPLAWLYLAIGGFVVLSIVGLLAALLRVLVAERLRTARPWLVRIAVGLLGLSGAGLAYLGVDSHRAVVGQSRLPLAAVLRTIQAPAITADPTLTVAFAILFVPLLALAIAVQTARRRVLAEPGSH